ncbi:DNA-binding protein [Streptomyces sp. NPDC005811]|uniref:DNA-binding protein n=1 Tax=Streptomyces sp. NPDC005811 TaxID=3154565 RepID=UPI0033ED1AC6
MREVGDSSGVGPVGARLTTWRRYRGLARDDLASQAGLDLAYVAGLESGSDWIDRRGQLAALAAVLRLDIADLTGQPYPPRGDEHAAVRAVAFHLRRRLVRRPPAASSGPMLEELAVRTRAAVQADADGDEHRLALALPGLIETADQAAASGHEEAERLRVQAHVLGAGLLRRLGYRDLAWMLLHRPGPGSRESLPVLFEEVRLLIDLGSPEYALARAERAEDAGEGAQLPALTALAHSMAGRRRQAEDVLDDAARQGASARDAAVLGAARAAVAAEDGDAEDAVALAGAVDHALLDGAQRSGLLVVTAAAEARRGRTGQAAARLDEADATAPFRLRLDPLARDLVAALAVRTTDPVQAAAVRNLAERTGLR